MDGWTFALTILAAVLGGGGLGTLILAIVSRRKASSEIAVNEQEAEKKEAEASEIITRAAGEAIKWMQSRLCELRAEVDALRVANVELRKGQDRQQGEINELQEMFDVVLAGAHVLHDQVVELNGTPKYKPPERRKK